MPEQQQRSGVGWARASQPETLACAVAAVWSLTARRLRSTARSVGLLPGGWARAQALTSTSVAFVGRMEVAVTGLFQLVLLRF